MRLLIVYLITGLLAMVSVLQAKIYKAFEYHTKLAYTSGRFEVYMKSAAGNGVVSSFFSYYDPLPFRSDHGNEIDIEILGCNTTEKISYLVSGFPVKKLAMAEDTRMVDLVMEYSDFTAAGLLMAQDNVDMSPKGNKMLDMPFKIDVGGIGGGEGYLADQIWDFSYGYGHTGGQIIAQAQSVDVLGTDDDAVWRTGLQGISHYSIRVPAGEIYQVSLLLAEFDSLTVGSRVFDVLIENTIAASHVDILALVGTGTAYTLKLDPVVIDDGVIDLCFVAHSGKSSLQGLIMEKMLVRVPVSDQLQLQSTACFPDFLEVTHYPNPFKEVTVISFDLSRSMPVELCIYNILGEKIRTLASYSPSIGVNTIVWNANDAYENQVSSGIYFYRIKGLHHIVTGSMMHIK